MIDHTLASKDSKDDESAYIAADAARKASWCLRACSFKGHILAPCKSPLSFCRSHSVASPSASGISLGVLGGHTTSHTILKPSLFLVLPRFLRALGSTPVFKSPPGCPVPGFPGVSGGVGVGFGVGVGVSAGVGVSVGSFCLASRLAWSTRLCRLAIPAPDSPVPDPAAGLDVFKSCILRGT